MSIGAMFAHGLETTPHSLEPVKRSPDVLGVLKVNSPATALLVQQRNSCAKQNHTQCSTL